MESRTRAGSEVDARTRHTIAQLCAGPLLVLILMADGGCGGGSGGPPIIVPQPASSTVSGSVMSGSTPISAASVTLFAANADGDKSLGDTTSGSNGGFSISYQNPGIAGILYLVAAGGNAGGGSNSAVTLVAVLGSASSVGSSTS